MWEFRSAEEPFTAARMPHTRQRPEQLYASHAHSDSNSHPHDSAVQDLDSRKGLHRQSASHIRAARQQTQPVPAGHNLEAVKSLLLGSLAAQQSPRPAHVNHREHQSQLQKQAEDLPGSRSSEGSASTGLHARPASGMAAVPARHPKLAHDLVQLDPATAWTLRASLSSNSMAAAQAPGHFPLPPGLGVPPMPSYTEARRLVASSSAALPSERQERQGSGTLQARASSASSAGPPQPDRASRMSSRRSLSRTGSGSSMASEQSEGSRLAVLHLRQLSSMRAPERPPGLPELPPGLFAASGEPAGERSGPAGFRPAPAEPPEQRLAPEPGRPRDSAASAILNIPAAHAQPGGHARPAMDRDWAPDPQNLRSIRLSQLPSHTRPGLPGLGSSHPMQDDAVLKYAGTPSSHSLPLMQPATPILRHPPAASSSSYGTRSGELSTGNSRSADLSPEVSSFAVLGTPPMAPPGLRPVPARDLQGTEGMPGLSAQLNPPSSQPAQEAASSSSGSTGPGMRTLSSLPHTQGPRGLMQALPAASSEPHAPAAAAAAASNGLGLAGSSSGTSAFMPSFHAGPRWPGCASSAAAAAASEAGLWQSRQVARPVQRPQSLPLAPPASGYSRHDLLYQAASALDRPEAPSAVPKFLSSSSRQRAVKQQTDQQSASPSGHYSGLLENGSAAGAQHRGGADAAGPGPAPAAAGSAGRATSFKLPPSPKSPTAWAEGLDPCTNLERLFLALTPVLRQGSERSPVLADVWQWYEEPSAYGQGIQLPSGSRGHNSAFYLPHLSAVQLLSGSPPSLPAGRTPVVYHVPAPPGGSGQVHLVRGHFEYMSPYARLPFSDSMEELAVSQAQLRTSPLTSVHMASWFSVAWYPICRIPDSSLQAQFLTFHSFVPVPAQATHMGALASPPLRPFMPSEAPDGPLVLPLIGIMWVNADGEGWLTPDETPLDENGMPGVDLVQLLESMQATAEKLAKGENLRHMGENGVLQQIRLQHPDFSYFSSRQSTLS